MTIEVAGEWTNRTYYLDITEFFGADVGWSPGAQ